MDILQQTGHQGDTQWYRISSLPEGAKKIEKTFAARSEQSGSVHALCGEYNMYEGDGVLIAEVTGPCVLNHTFESNLNERSLHEAKTLPKKDHRHSELKPGLYATGVQQRYDPFSKLWVNVVD